MGPPARPAAMPPAARSGKAVPPPRTMDVAGRVGRNPALARRLEPLLPSGMSLDTAAAGFKNQGQFIAALHVSRNLSIPFMDLKDRMTGPQPQSLGAAIHSLQPAMPPGEVRQAERLAESQAKMDQRLPK